MDAKTQMLEYAAKYNDGKVYTNEQWLGKMVTEGVRLSHNTVANCRREGKTIIITETVTTDGYDMAKMQPIKNRTTIEVMRINL